MESRYVRHFLAAHETGSFSAAADQLGLSAQAISKSILRLEADLGVRLFERRGRQLRPTAYADLLVPHARTIASEADQFRAGLRDMLGGLKGRLRIGAGPSAAAELVASAIATLFAASPDVRLGVLVGDYEAMVGDLAHGRLDVIVSVRRLDLPDMLVREEQLATMRYIIVCGAGHPLAGQAKPSLSDVAKARWMVGASLGDVERSIDASFTAAGVRRAVPEIETNSVVYALAMLERGRHVAIMPEALVARDIASGQLVRLSLPFSPWERPLVVGTRVRGPRPPLVDTFVAHLRKCAAVQVD